MGKPETGRDVIDARDSLPAAPVSHNVGPALYSVVVRKKNPTGRIRENDARYFDGGSQANVTRDSIGLLGSPDSVVLSP